MTRSVVDAGVRIIMIRKPIKRLVNLRAVIVSQFGRIRLISRFATERRSLLFIREFIPRVME